MSKNEKKIDDNTLQRFLKEKPAKLRNAGTVEILLPEEEEEVITVRNFGRKPGKIVYVANTEVVRKI